MCRLVASYSLVLLHRSTRALSVRSEACEGATAYTQFATWAAAEYLARRVATRTREAGEASIQSVGNKHGSRGCRAKRGTGWGPSGKH